MPAFKPGTYQLRTNESYEELARILNAGPTGSAVLKLAIPEGFAIRDIVKVLEKNGISAEQYLEAASVATPPAGVRPPARDRVEGLEGFLFPATYELETPVRPETLVRDQLDAFTRAMAGGRPEVCALTGS